MSAAAGQATDIGVPSAGSLRADAQHQAGCPFTSSHVRPTKQPGDADGARGTGEAHPGKSMTGPIETPRWSQIASTERGREPLSGEANQLAGSAPAEHTSTSRSRGSSTRRRLL